MASPGDFRFNKASLQWEIFLGERGWVSLASYAPEFANAIEGTTFTRIEDFEGTKQRQFGYQGDDPGEENAEWYTYDQLVDAYGADKGRPPFQSRAAAEQAIAANPELEGYRPIYKNGDWILEPAQAEKPSGAFSTAAAARQRAASDPDLAGYQPRYNSSDGQWYLDAPDTADSPIAKEAAKLEAEAALVRAQQQQQQAARPKSIDDVILQALLDGNEDKALYFQHFQDRPTRLQALAFAMQYAESPEEFDQLFALAQGPALDYADTQPVFSQSSARLLSSLPPSLGGQQAPPTTAALQADAASQSVRFTPDGGTQRWDRENQVWVDVNLPDATSRPTANGGLLPIPTPKQGKGPFMPEEPTFAQEESTFGAKGVEPFQFKPPAPALEPPIDNQEFEPFMAAGPDLGDVPTAKEMREASLRTGGKGVIAPPGVLIPDFVKNSPNTIGFYNPDKINQFYDFVNEFREQSYGSKAGAFTAPEGATEDDYLDAKAAQLGIQNPLRKKKPAQTFTPPASVFNRKKQPEPEPQPTFRTPRYIGAR